MNSGFDGILLNQYHRYPAMQIVDVYKLVHQASLGSEHAIRDRAAVQRWLDQELATLGDGPDEPLLDPITPSGSIMRIHLRPFLARGGNPDTLIDAFVRTANEFRGSATVLESFWAEVIRMGRAGKLGYSPIEAEEFRRQMAARNYSAAHHSQVYRSVYQPAYRVVARKFWPDE